VLDLVALPGARPGARALNLMNTVYAGGEYRSTELNDARLTLNPAPTNAPNDPVDGSVVVAAPTIPTKAARTRSSAAPAAGTGPLP
jgi:hypothetical protein